MVNEKWLSRRTSAAQTETVKSTRAASITAVSYRQQIATIVLAALLGVGTLLFYWATLAPTVGFIDAPSYLRRAVELDLGVSSNHHPLYTLLGHWFIQLAMGDNPAYRLNLLTAIFGAAATAMLCLVVVRLSGSFIAGAIAALALATSHTFWWSSTEAEVYTLNALFLGAILYGLVAYHQTRRLRWLLVMAFCGGLGVANHQQLALAAPPIFIYLLSAGRPRVWRWWPMMFGAGLLGGAFYGGLIVQLAVTTSWALTVNELVGGGFRHLLILDVHRLDEPLGALLRFAGLTLFGFGLPFTLLAAAGMWKGVRDTQRWLYVTLIGVLLCNTIFIAFYSVPDRVFFYLPSFYVIAILLGAGVAALVQGVTAPDERRMRRARLAVALFFTWEAFVLFTALFVLWRADVAFPIVASGILAALAGFILLAWLKAAPRRFAVALAVMALLAPLTGRPLVYAAAREVVRPILSSRTHAVALDFPLPTIPGRDNVGYYVYPGKEDVVAGEWYCRALQTVPHAAIIVDDWSHGLAILTDYCQRVLGLRQDVTVLPWYAESLVGTEAEEQEQAMAYFAQISGLWLPPREGTGLGRIVAYVARAASAGRPVFLTTDQFPLDALIVELGRRGLTRRSDGLLLRVAPSEE